LTNLMLKICSGEGFTVHVKVQYLAGDQKAIETIRDIHDKTNVPVIFVGMTLAEKKLARYRHLYDRLSEIVHFKAFSLNDVREIIT
jgi:hypothetical protein